jgi:hypothetical protein
VIHEADRNSQGEWAGKSAGGCLNFPSWRLNQQIFISSKENKTVKVKLQQDGPDLHHIGFYVIRVRDGMQTEKPAPLPFIVVF